MSRGSLLENRELQHAHIVICKKFIMKGRKLGQIYQEKWDL